MDRGFIDAEGNPLGGSVTFTRLDTGEEYSFPIRNGLIQGVLPWEEKAVTWRARVEN